MAVGKLAEFNLEIDCWEAYIERLEQYFVCNAVKDELKVATLITAIGAEAYELMTNLCIPHKPATKPFAELIDIVGKHLKPRPSVLVERYNFRRRIQKPTENIKDFVADLKKLAKNCKFINDSLTENLRDQFVCGLKNESIRHRLFTEQDVSFNRAYDIALAMESAETNAALVSKNQDTQLTSICMNSANRRHYTDKQSGGQVKNVVLRQDSRSSKYYRSNNNNCYICGYQHNPQFCRYKFCVCEICNKVGHLKRMCPQRKGATNLNNVEETMRNNNTDKAGSSDEEEVFNHSIRARSFEDYPPYTICIKINDKSVMMEIDTGSAISCINKETYDSMFTNCKMYPSELKLRYYTGELKEPLGKIRPLVVHGECKKLLDLFVIENGKTSLLGRQWINELKIYPYQSSILKMDDDQKDINMINFSSRFSKVFADGLGRYTGGTVGFHLREGAQPIFLRARPLAYALREPVERALEQLQRDGVISPVSTSDWATPIVPVMKKDGTIRLCGDFKLTLNKCLEIDRFPLPRVDDLLAKLHGGEKFSKIDLSQAYTQFELDDSKKFTVINTHKGLFQYNRLVFGLASSPGIFQRKMEQIFSDLPGVGVFLDDLIITGRDDQSHLATLNEVFTRLEKWGLRVRKDKCTLLGDSVTYLGFVIDKNGVHTDPLKVEAIKNVKAPTSVSDLRSFLGLVMYYAKFVPNMSTILAPLYELLKKGSKFLWDPQCERAFNKIKDILISSQVLIHYSLDLPLVLTTDASSVGIGAVISHITSQGEKPIAYASRTLNSAEKNYSQIEREALSIIFGVRKFHQYLYGRKFVLRTDHKPLVTIFGDKAGIPVMAASRMQRWAVILGGYDYKIEYVSSKCNSADALSRLPVGQQVDVKPENTYFSFVQSFLPITRKEVQEELSKDCLLRKVVGFLQAGWPDSCPEPELQPYYTRRNELYLDTGCIAWGYRLVIPDSLRSYVLKELHVGHMGIVKMKSIARSFVWWPGIDADIERICKECATCLAESPAPPKAAIQPWPHETEPWSRLHVDFLGPLDGKTFLVVIDATSKWLEVFHMQRTTACAVIKVLRETFARFGLPKQVVSDNGPPFSSREYLDFMIGNGIKVTFTAVHHPASNGAAEGAVKICKRALRKSARDGCDLEAALQAYLLAYRNVEHITTGASPAMLLQRRSLRTRLDHLRRDRLIEDKVQAAKQKQISDAGGKARAFQIGEPVVVRNYTGGQKWVRGRVDESVGTRHYVVDTGQGPLKRHIDQIKAAAVPFEEADEPGTSLSGPAGNDPAAGEGAQSLGNTPVSVPTPSAVPPGRLHRPKRLTKPIIRLGI